jgi:hypothetical protein
MTMAEASRADSKAIVLRQHKEVWSQGNLAAVDEIYAANFVGYHPGMPDWVGPEGVKEAVTTVRSALADTLQRPLVPRFHFRARLSARGRWHEAL